LAHRALSVFVSVKAVRVWRMAIEAFDPEIFIQAMFGE